MSAARVALIASPLQAMSLQEALTAGVIDLPDAVVVRGPRRQIDGILALADPRLCDAAATHQSRFAQLRLLCGATEVVIGDPFSRLAHLTWITGRASRVVILEDGAAVLRARRALAAEHPSLVRAHGGDQMTKRLADRATRRLRLLAERSNVTLAGGLPMPHEVEHGLKQQSFAVARHEFAWSRQVLLPADPAFAIVGRAGRIVLGSALAADGHLDRHFYRQWLEQHLDGGRALFLPHRRDEPWARQLAEEQGALAVTSHHLPAELLLRDVGRELEVESLPMTLALTLPLVRAHRPTRLRVTRLAARHWTPNTPASMIALVDDIADLAAAQAES